MKKGTVVILLLFCGMLAVAQPSEALKKFLSSEALRHAAVGISVKKVSNGQTVAEYNPSVALAPASLTKLITTSLALKVQGADFRYKTSLLYAGRLKNDTLYGNLIIEAHGDPCLDSRYFPDNRFTEQIIATLKQLGIRSIEGRISVKTDLKEKEIPGSWVWEDISNYYGALWHPFNYRDNMYLLEFSTGAPETPAEVVGIMPEVPGITLVNQVTASKQGGDDAWIFGGPYSQEIHVRGTIPAHRASFKIKGAIHNPAETFIHELSQKLVTNGISVGKKVYLTEQKTLLREFVSPSLKEIVYHTNKTSINLFAEALGSLINEANSELSSLGIDASGVQLKDACGLSQQNAVPAEVFTDLLIWSNKHLGVSFTASLPLAGKDGGLSNYSNHPSLNGNLSAKTGSFGGVRCLSGYLKNRAGERLAFTIMVNHYSCETSALYRAMRQLLVELAQ